MKLRWLIPTDLQFVFGVIDTEVVAWECKCPETVNYSLRNVRCHWLRWQVQCLSFAYLNVQSSSSRPSCPLRDETRQGRAWLSLTRSAGSSFLAALTTRLLAGQSRSNEQLEIPGRWLRPPALYRNSTTMHRCPRSYTGDGEDCRWKISRKLPISYRNIRKVVKLVDFRHTCNVSLHIHSDWLTACDCTRLTNLHCPMWSQIATWAALELYICIVACKVWL